MKLAISTFLLAFVLSLVSAAPLSADQYNNLWRFKPIAGAISSILNLRGIHANGRHFWIGKETSTYCPLQDVPCPPGNETVLDVSGGGASLVRSSYSWCFSLVVHDMSPSLCPFFPQISSFPHPKQSKSN